MSFLTAGCRDSTSRRRRTRRLRGNIGGHVVAKRCLVRGRRLGVQGGRQGGAGSAASGTFAEGLPFLTTGAGAEVSGAEFAGAGEGDPAVWGMFCILALMDCCWPCTSCMSFWSVARRALISSMESFKD